MSPSLTPKKPQADLGRYERHQKAAGAPTRDLHEETGLRIGGWGFYYRDSPGGRQDVVAIDAEGRSVCGVRPSEWYALLSAEGLDAGAALRRACWLLVRPGPVGPDQFEDPEVAASIAGPSLRVDDSTATLEGWVVYPPETQVPFRLRIEARPDTPTTADVQRWSRPG